MNNWPRTFEAGAAHTPGENQDHDLGVVATRSSRGYVELRWGITPSIYDKWGASVGIEVEAGAEMSALARELTSFFAI